MLDLIQRMDGGVTVHRCFKVLFSKEIIDLNIVSDLATRYEVSEDGKVWTVILRNDVKFSDGIPLTAADVQFTFETALNNGSVVDLNMLAKVEATTEETVTFFLKKVAIDFH